MVNRESAAGGDGGGVVEVGGCWSSLYEALDGGGVGIPEPIRYVLHTLIAAKDGGESDQTL